TIADKASTTSSFNMTFSLTMLEIWLFFFSCRRRHSTFSRDWSSDVCSSDLAGGDLHRNRSLPGAGRFAGLGPGLGGLTDLSRTGDRKSVVEGKCGGSRWRLRGAW